MDSIVQQALAKWPNVPDCHGWLALDARGQWRIGERTPMQPFQVRQPITQRSIIAFINRNYFADEQGRWLFQNGPQRVYVELEYTPYVWRLLPGPNAGGWCLVAHTGQEASNGPADIWLDTQGRFLIEAAIEDKPCIGVVHDHDSALLAEWLCDKNGDVLDEAIAAQRIDALMQTPSTSSQLWIRWPQREVMMNVRGIEYEQVGRRFNFVSQP